ncbi:MAG: TetR/AcrR family transcriptional regulator [Alphaproteobacteria bacterium]|nr:TetR/AcrR family transcriptional regulator [Alphaproteobacteria bacterium]
MLNVTRSERTRQTVLDAAERAFRESGFQGATSASIARDAGVSEGSVFGHFGSKSGLLLAVMERYYADAFARLDERADSVTAPEERLRGLIREWLERVVDDWALVRVFSQHGRYSDDAAVRDAYHAYSRDLTRRFVAALSELRAAGRIGSDLPMSLLRDVIFGTGEHVALRWPADGDRRALLETADRIADLVLRAGRPVPDPGEATLASLDAKLDRVLATLGAPS